MAKKPTKARKARKATKGPRKARKAASSAPRKRRAKTDAAALLARAHAAVMRAIPLVDAAHREAILKIDRAIEHARENASHRGARS